MMSARARYWRVTLTTTIILLLSSCQSAPPTTTQGTIHSPTQPPPIAPPTRMRCAAPPEWSLSFTLSGGFAGEQKSLRLMSDGRLLALDERLGRQGQTSLEEDELRSITQLLEGACPFSDVVRSPSCADCFVYSIELNWGGEQHRVAFNDINLNETGYGLLIKKLNDLREQTLSDEQN